MSARNSIRAFLTAVQLYVGYLDLVMGTNVRLGLAVPYLVSFNVSLSLGGNIQSLRVCCAKYAGNLDMVFCCQTFFSRFRRSYYYVAIPPTKFKFNVICHLIFVQLMYSFDALFQSSIFKRPS